MTPEKNLDFLVNFQLAKLSTIQTKIFRKTNCSTEPIQWNVLNIIQFYKPEPESKLSNYWKEMNTAYAQQDYSYYKMETSSLGNRMQLEYVRQASFKALVLKFLLRNTREVNQDGLQGYRRSVAIARKKSDSQLEKQTASKPLKLEHVFLKYEFITTCTIHNNDWSHEEITITLHANVIILDPEHNNEVK